VYVKRFTQLFKRWKQFNVLLRIDVDVLQFLCGLQQSTREIRRLNDVSLFLSDLNLCFDTKHNALHVCVRAVVPLSECERQNDDDAGQIFFMLTKPPCSNNRCLLLFSRCLRTYEVPQGLIIAIHFFFVST